MHAASERQEGRSPDRPDEPLAHATGAEEGRRREASSAGAGDAPRPASSKPRRRHHLRLVHGPRRRLDPGGRPRGNFLRVSLRGFRRSRRRRDRRRRRERRLPRRLQPRSAVGRISSPSRRRVAARRGAIPDQHRSRARRRRERQIALDGLLVRFIHRLRWDARRAHLRDGRELGGAQPPSTPSLHAAVPDAWQPHPMDPLRFVKAEIRQLLLQRGALSIAQLPEEYLKCYRKPLTQALKKLDSQYTPESARSGKPSGRARKSTLGAFLREHLTDVVEVRQRPHGQHEIVAAGVGGSPALGDAPNGEAAGGATPSLLQLQQQQQMRARRLQQQQQLLQLQWRQDTPKHATQALVSQQQQQHQRRRQLNQLRVALHQVNVGDSPRRSLERTPTMFSTLSPTYSGGPLPASPRSDDVSLNLPADVNEPLMSSKPVRDALMSASAQQIGAFSAGGASTFAPHAAANLLAASHPSAGAGAIAAAAVGALRGAALLSATASDIPAENRIYVTWRVPSKATQLRVEDLWGYFSRFGQLAFCNPRPLRNSNAPRRTPSLSGAGYAFLGFSNPGGAEAVTRVLSRPSHALRGAELRVKQWRDRDEGTGTGDTPAVVPSSAVDAPPATVGEYYFAHPESGVPVLAPSVDSASVGGLASSTAASSTVAGARDFSPPPRRRPPRRRCSTATCRTAQTRRRSTAKGSSTSDRTETSTRETSSTQQRRRSANSPRART